MNPFRQALENWTADDWCQGAAYDNGRECLVGRLHRSGYRTEDHSILLNSLLPERYENGKACLGPTHWNDQAGRTFDEIRGLLERAATAWDAR